MSTMPVTTNNGTKKNMPDKVSTPWSLSYARSLSKEQWEDEIRSRFFDAIRREIESGPFREPLRSFLEKLNVNFAGKHPFLFSWDIYSALVVEDKSQLKFTAWFYAITYPWDQSEPDPESIWFMETGDDESKTFLIAFDGIIRIDQAGGVGSEISEIYTDPDLMPNFCDREDNDFIYGFQGC
jgi:hypothetical protein